MNTRLLVPFVAIMLVCSMSLHLEAGQMPHAGDQFQINYTDDTNRQAAIYAEGGVEVSGSDLVRITMNSGLGVRGGLDSQWVDDQGSNGNEYLDFTSAGDTVFTFFIFQSRSIRNHNGGEINSFTVEGFGPNGDSIGFIDYENSSLTNLGGNFVAEFGYQPLKTVRVTSTGDHLLISAIEIAAEGFSIPEPNTASLIVVLTGCLATVRFRGTA